MVKKCVVKVYEAHWDRWNEESVAPFFKQLRRSVIANPNATITQARKNHDPFFTYDTFHCSKSLGAALQKPDPSNCAGRERIAYLACHGDKSHLLAVQSKTRIPLRVLIEKIRLAKENENSFKGFYFGACDFLSRKTAEQLLGETELGWVAGYDTSIPWMESMMADLMFFTLLTNGFYSRFTSGTRDRYEKICDPRKTPNRCSNGMDSPDSRSAARCMSLNFARLRCFGFGRGR